MDVYEAVTSRRAVRGFTDQPVLREVLERVLSAAAWSPSGSNLQPWNIYVVTGAPLAELKKRAVERVANSVLWDEREYVMYPPAMKSPYRERRSAFGHERYSALGIAREDWEARQRAAIANWDCFGAPAALFCYIDRDLGCYLVTMLCAPGQPMLVVVEDDELEERRDRRVSRPS